jgi:hypothetical protein
MVIALMLSSASARDQRAASAHTLRFARPPGVSGRFTLIAAQPQAEVCVTEVIATAREPLIIGPP